MNGFRPLHSNIGVFRRSKVDVGIILLACVHDSGPRARKNISGALSFAHKSGKACGKNRKSTTNPPNFNAMMRFAPFLCNRVFPEIFLRESQNDLARIGLSAGRLVETVGENISNTISAGAQGES
jgi:hypothetical protein